MALDNPLWRAPRIHRELQMLGIAVSERTVSRILLVLCGDNTSRRGQPAMTQGSDVFLADAEFTSGCGLGDAVAPKQDNAFRLDLVLEYSFGLE